MYSDLARMGLGGKRVMECKRGTTFLNHSKQPLLITHFLLFFFFFKLVLTTENELKKKTQQYSWIWSCLHTRSDLAKEETSHLHNGL